MSKSAQSVTPRRRFGRTAALMLALVVLVSLAGYYGLRRAQTKRVQTALPALPANTPNATLRDLLVDARAAATTGRLEAVAELGRLFHANEFRAEAEACWRILAREQPKEARWHYYLADLLRMAGDLTGVEGALEATVAADPKAATAWLQLAEMKLKSGRLDAAAENYQRRLALLPDDPYAGLGLARVAQLQGRTAETIERLEQLLKQHPKFSAAQNLYAELQAAAGREELADLHRWLGREAGRFREADDPWIEELNTRCREPRRLCHLGVIAYQTNQGDRGRARFEQAIALAPGYALAHELLGALLLEEGATVAARDTLLRGIENAAPDSGPTAMHFLKLNEAYVALKQPGPARRTLEVGLRQHPDSADLLHAWGNRLKAEGNRTEAAQAYRRAIEVNPAFVEADFALAVLLVEAERLPEAAQALQRALTMQPTFPKALLLLARLEVDAGRVEEAGRFLLPLLKANPGEPEIRRITASWRLRAGRALEQRDPAAAERHYRAGLVLQPDHPDLNAGLGVLLLISDRPGEAVAPLEIAHRARPTQAQAALFLGQAYVRSGRPSDARRVLTAGLHQAEQSGQAASVRNFQEILSILPP
ncbi:tetratricopeptide repeat protein [Oleiharenicola lentus]|uniref:Tetratricopeptide repeat protein n=1 Tax=Oleiharenicola lentus TaxID=2508720 RepID=A0A4Q1C5H1_9BACT|nr:tetratricopeptide repeat protein [Oleiharenicola lentus]RXK53539.1 tetratricopeptide repeat protein [Oleiharenicola lentus]